MTDFREHVIFLVIVPSSPKLVPIFDDRNDSCIGGWFLGVVSNVASDAYICWMTYSKIFCSCSSFSQSFVVLVFPSSFSYGSTNLGFWLLVAIVKTMLIVTSSFFSYTWETLFRDISCHWFMWIVINLAF